MTAPGPCRLRQLWPRASQFLVALGLGFRVLWLRVLGFGVLGVLGAAWGAYGYLSELERGRERERLRMCRNERREDVGFIRGYCYFGQLVSDGFAWDLLGGTADVDA